MRTTKNAAEIERLQHQVAELRAALAWALPFIHDEWTGTTAWKSGEVGQEYARARALLDEEQQKG